jgi:hypothetical protein
MEKKLKTLLEKEICCKTQKKNGGVNSGSEGLQSTKNISHRLLGRRMGLEYSIS